MSEGSERTRNHEATDVLILVPFEGEDARDQAVSFGAETYNGQIGDPFAVCGSGVIDAGYWPAFDDVLVTLNDDKGKLPDNADLKFGLSFSIANDAYFHGIKKLDDGRFATIIVAGKVFYDEIVEAEPAAEAAAEGDGTGEPAADAGTAGDEPPPPETQTQDG